MGLGRGKPSSGRVQGTTPLGALGANSQGANPGGQPFGGWFPSNPPQMAPLISGLLGFARSIPGRYSADFHRFIWTFLGDYS